MKKLTKNDIISLSLESAAQIRVPPDQLTHFDTMYELMKESMLKERPWLFTLAVTTDLQPTEEGGERGFRYKYLVPKDCVDVLMLNPDSAFPPTLSPDIARTVGISIDPESYPYGNLRPKYVFVDGVLHTDTTVTKLLYKKDAPEAEWPGDFSLALMWSLAEFIATTRSQKREIVAKARQMKREYTLKAIRPILDVGPDPVTELALNHWLHAYYSALYQQGV